jgi:hypothetical protein
MPPTKRKNEETTNFAHAPSYKRAMHRASPPPSPLPVRSLSVPADHCKPAARPVSKKWQEEGHEYGEVVEEEVDGDDCNDNVVDIEDDNYKYDGIDNDDEIDEEEVQEEDDDDEEEEQQQQQYFAKEPSSPDNNKDNEQSTTNTSTIALQRKLTTPMQALAMKMPPTMSDVSPMGRVPTYGQNQGPGRANGCKDLTHNERILVLGELRKHMHLKRLPSSITQTIADYYKVALNTIMIYNQRLRKNKGDIELTAKNNRKHPRGHYNYAEGEIEERIRAVPLESRTSLRKLSEATGLSLRILHIYVKQNKLSPYVFSSK